MREVSIRELKTHLGEYVRRLRQGEQLTLTDRGKPLAVISPLVETDEQRIDRKLQ
jgi:prevent-host-death family protein